MTDDSNLTADIEALVATCKTVTDAIAAQQVRTEAQQQEVLSALAGVRGDVQYLARVRQGQPADVWYGGSWWGALGIAVGLLACGWVAALLWSGIWP